MAIPITAILKWCGITITAQRNRIMNKLLIAPEGMRHLNDESTKGMIATFRDYGRRDVADGKIMFNRVQQKRMISLKDWVEDKVWLQEEVEFETVTTGAEFIKAIEEASERKNAASTRKRQVNHWSPQSSKSNWKQLPSGTGELLNWKATWRLS